MADTRRTLSALQALLANNTAGDISAQDVRDMLVSVCGSTLIDEQIASSSASLDFTSLDSSLYDDYMLRLTSIVPATNNVDLRLRFSTDGGATYITSGYEYAAIDLSTSNVGPGGLASSSASEILLFTGIANDQSYGVTGHVDLHDLANAALKKSVEFQICATFQAVTRRYYTTGGGFYGTAVAVNGIRIIFSSGAITSGVARLYGFAK